MIFFVNMIKTNSMTCMIFTESLPRPIKLEINKKSTKNIYQLIMTTFHIPLCLLRDTLYIKNKVFFFLRMKCVKR